MQRLQIRTFVWSVAAAIILANGQAALSGDEPRVLHKETVVPATVDQVWRAWTTPEGMAEFWVSGATIELRPLGKYELYMVPDAPEGQRGSEGCKVLSFVPQEMLSFQWNFPPSIPALRDVEAQTQVILRFEELDGGRVRVRLDQLGWEEGEAWDAGYAYFDRAWSYVLDRLQAHFQTQAGQPQSWVDGAVTVTVEQYPIKRQIFSVEVPAPVATVWETMTTVDGVRSFLSPDPRIELAVGGAYELFPGSTQRVQAFVPQRMLVVTGSAPLEFPNVRQGGTWAVLEFAALDDARAQVRMTCAGWQEGQEWEQAFEYFLENNPVFLNLLRKRFAEGPLEWTRHDDGPPTFERISR